MTGHKTGQDRWSQALRLRSHLNLAYTWGIIVRACETLSHLSPKTLNMIKTQEYVKCCISHIPYTHSLRTSTPQWLPKRWNTTESPNRLFFNEQSLTISPTCTHKNVSTLKAGCSNAKTRCSSICTWAKHCKAMYHVPLMHVHNPHIHAPQSRRRCPIIPNSCEEQCQHAVLEGWLTEMWIFQPETKSIHMDNTIHNMSFHLVVVSSYHHGSETWSFHGHAIGFKCHKMLNRSVQDWTQAQHGVVESCLERWSWNLFLSCQLSQVMIRQMWHQQKRILTCI